jgi:hypothetical protein
VGGAWSCAGAPGDGPVSRECKGEISCELEGPVWGREQIGAQGKEREGNQHRSTFDGVVFYMGVSWDGAVP